MSQPVGQALPDAPPATSPSQSLTAPFGSVWAALLWKEWREHRGKLLALSAGGLSLLLPLARTMRGSESEGTAFAYTMVIAPLAALFVAMGIAAGERASGALAFARCLPVSPWQLALAKLIAAVLTVAVPVSFALPVAPEELFTLGPVLLLVTLSLVLWFAVLGRNRPDEVSAGAFGVAGVVLAWAMFLIGLFQINSIGERSGIQEWNRTINEVIPILAAPFPGGILLKGAGGPAERVAWFWLLAAYATTHVPLAWLWLNGSGGLSSRVETATGSASEPKAWLAAPLASPTAAILWKQFRETTPVAIVALSLAVAWTLAVATVEDLGDGSVREHLVNGVFAFVVLACLTAFLAAVVAGVGLFLEDLRPGVHTFWRSRPIPPDRWFWLKYTAGFACLAVVFGGVIAMAGLIIWGFSELDSAMSLPVYVLSVLGFWMVYSCAACACCLVRQPIYAAVLGAGLPALLYGLIPYLMDKRGFSPETIEPTQAVLVVLAGVAATLLAWQAVRRDWAILR